MTTHTYASTGELKQVVLPDGKTIEDLHDSQGRRIAKKVNSIITEKYLWEGLRRLLAVYDGSDNLLMRFDYAAARVPVAMEGRWQHPLPHPRPGRFHPAGHRCIWKYCKKD